MDEVREIGFIFDGALTEIVPSLVPAEAGDLVTTAGVGGIVGRQVGEHLIDPRLEPDSVIAADGTWVSTCT